VRKVTDAVNKLTHSPLIQVFDHIQGFLNIWNLLFEPSSPLRKVCVHVPVLSAGWNGR